jgi:hypothetical protein
MTAAAIIARQSSFIIHHSSFINHHSAFCIMRPSVPDVHITDSEDAELAAYRALAGQAVLGLIFGLLSPLALVDPMCWGFPAVGIILSVWALRRIKKSDSLTGRKMAVAGLLLSLLFAAAAPTDALAYRRTIRSEARQFSSLWFQFLIHDEPQKAHQLTVAPAIRHFLDDRLWAFYRSEPRLRQQLEGYVKNPLVHTLLALGPKAEVRFYETADQTQDGNDDMVTELYAVTYEEEGEKKSFLVAVDLLRQKLATGEAGWCIRQTNGPVRPEGSTRD